MRGVAEELDGHGKILKDGIELGEVAYSIKVYKAGFKEWQYPYVKFRERGYLKLHEIINKPVTLVLEDGRRWECRLSSLDGTVVAEGNWPAKGGQSPLSPV